MDTQRTIERTPVRVSLTRPVSLGGGDRDLMMALYTFGLAIVCTSMTELSILIPAAVLLLSGHWVIVQLSTYDAHWRVIMLRHIRYAARTYTATAHPAVPRQKPLPSVPPVRYLQ